MKSVVRLGTAGLFAAAGLLVILYRTAYRQIETVLAGGATHTLLSGGYFVNRDTETFFLHTGTSKVFGVVVTPVCSSAVISGVILAITAVVVASSRFSLLRALLAALASAGGFALLNLGRVILIAFASNESGIRAGYQWSHDWAGTFVTVFGGVLAAVVYLVLLGGGRQQNASAD